jgi:hypothetical protein
MNHFEQRNEEHEYDGPIQIEELDSTSLRKNKHAETILTVLHQNFKKPWRIYTLFGALLLILLGVIVLEYHWPLAGTSSYTSATSFPSMKTSVTPALLQLQQRPLHLPTIAPGDSCPTTAEKRVTDNFGIAQGDGPVYATIGADAIAAEAVFHYVDAQHLWQNNANSPKWGGQKVLWFVNPNYQGLVLVRGKQMDGPHAILFSDGPGQPLTPQHVFDTTSGGSPWPNSSSYTRLQAPGCYAYQVDGANFSYGIVFRAVVQN